VQLADREAKLVEMPENTALLHEFGEMIELLPSGRRAAVRALAVKYGRTTRDIYERLEQAKISVKR
jgi:hypothetical protein